MSLPPTSGPGPRSGSVEDRLTSIVGWIDEIDGRLRAAELLSGDEKTAKELRKAVEALSKHDPKLEERLVSRVDVLTDRVATLATTVSTTAAALARKDGEIAGLHRDLDAGTARLAELAGTMRGTAGSDAELAELRAAVAAVSEQKLPKRVDARIDDLKASFAILTQRLETLSSTVSNTAAGLAGREGEVAALRRKVEDDAARVATEIFALRNAIDPAPVAELRQAVKEIAAETAALRRDDRRGIDGVKASVTSLADRVDVTAAAAAAAAHELAAGEQRLGALQASVDEENARVDTLLVKLHETTVELAARVGELSGDAAAEAVDELAATVSALTARVDTMATSLEDTVDGYSKREFEIAALSRRFEEISDQVDTGVRELRAAFDEIPEHRSDPELESRVADLGEALTALAGRVEAMDASVTSGWSAAAQAAASLDYRVSEITKRLDAGEAAGLEQRVSELSADAARASETWESQRATLAAESNELRERIAIVGVSLEESEASIASLQAALGSVGERADVRDEEIRKLGGRVDARDDEIRKLGERSDARDEEIRKLGERSDVRDEEIRELGGRFEKASARVNDLVAELHAALETMPAQLKSDELESALSGLAGRLDALEQGRSTAALEIARASSAWTDERSQLREDLTALQAALDGGLTDLAALRDATPAESPGSSEQVSELSERLDRADLQRAELASEIAGARAFWSSGLGAIEARLEALASGKDETGRKVDDEVVSALFDIARRLDAVEQGRAASDAEVVRTAESWSAERESIAAGLDELARRLDALDPRTDADSGSGASTTPVEDADGRHRLELRALELRLEHAEAAAREHRDAVLVQLERLASRIEWRLHRLETGAEDGAPELADAPLAQVVSIHGGDA